jgi:hypothetical protein
MNQLAFPLSKLLLLCLLMACSTPRPMFPPDEPNDTQKQLSEREKQLLEQMANTAIRDSQALHAAGLPWVTLRLRIVEVVRPGRATLPENRVQRSVEILNEHFAAARLYFQLIRHEKITRNITLPQLQERSYEPYLEFSRELDIAEAVTLYLVDNKEDLCSESSCSRSHGFSFVLSDATNNVVLDKFFVDDHKTLVHEFGHYFGLLHTFDTQNGVETVNGDNCATAGDMICDTPADPGPMYAVYVNQSTCEMADFREPVTGLMYRPMINNFMSYYKPCYLRAYYFTQGQLDMIRTSAMHFRPAIVIKAL